MSDGHPNKESLKQIPELDGLRGLAALLIVLFHTFPKIFFFGWSAVDFFFVLSGFLITRIIISQQQHANFLKSFYIKRIFRIWPVYFSVLFLVLLANHLSPHPNSTQRVLYYLVFLQHIQSYFSGVADTGPADFIYAFGPSWSVAVEEQYYLAWPLVLLIVGPGSIPMLSAGLIALSVVGRIYFCNYPFLIATRGDGLALGCLLAYLLSMPGPVWAQRTSQLLGILGTLGLIYVVCYVIQFWGMEDDNIHQGWFLTRYTGFSALAFSVIGYCVVHSGHIALQFLQHPGVRWLGTISYTVYLIHMPILVYSVPVLIRLGITSHWVVLLITFLSIFGIASLSWIFFEKPLLNYSRRLITRL